MKLWRLRYGNESEIQDYTDNWIKRDHYEGSGISSDYVWNIDHLIPKSRCGGDNQDNLVICRIETNEEKADRTSWIGYDADGDLINLQINRKRIINQDTREVLYDPKWYK
ncbi:hypothetical protein NW739_01520 [Mycoplasmopsis felis]|uniref:HNH endonuclease domain-containing protein n=1 Tax=Mycoplasmopsis felis TaxID=33923 RepID=UPI0021E0F8D9|nr:HNH endonuclease domain-containing protein [Mycoplasmopsis felis]MCU9939486.1 hypothetical protein [Mycoplasmopsis felis]